MMAVLFNNKYLKISDGVNKDGVSAKFYDFVKDKKEATKFATKEELKRACAIIGINSLITIEED